MFVDDCTGDPAARWQTIGGDAAVVYEPQSLFTALWYSFPPYYRGAWATGPANTRPMQQYVSAVQKTFFVWSAGKTPTWVCLGVYDHQSGQVAYDKMTTIATDPHRNGSIVVLASGHIMVFCGSHSDDTQVWRSSAPYDITTMVHVDDIVGSSGRTTYPNPIEMPPGQLRLYYRGPSKSWCLRYNGYDGLPGWGAEHIIIQGAANTWNYVTMEPDPAAGVVHMVWTVYFTGFPDARRDIYYARGSALTWENAAGASLPVPIDQFDQSCRVFDSDPDDVSTPQDVIVFNGQPIILFSHGLATTPWTWRAARYVGGQWMTSVIAAGDSQFDHGALGSDAIGLYALLPSLPNQPGEDGGGIQRWRSADGGATWTLAETITGDTLSHNFVKRVKDGAPEFTHFWTSGDAAQPTPCFLSMIGSRGLAPIAPGDPYVAAQMKFTGTGAVETIPGGLRFTISNGALVKVEFDN